MPGPRSEQAPEGLELAPSLLFNNLSSCSGPVAYVSGNQVCLLPASKGKQTFIRPLGDKARLCIHSRSGTCCPDHSIFLQVWDAQGSRLLFSWALPATQLLAGLAPVPTFARGITATGAADGSCQICVGASSGRVYVFDASSPVSLTPTATLQHDMHAIAALGSPWQGRRGKPVDDVSCSLVSSDEYGGICLWEAASSTAFVQRHQLVGHGTPCVAVGVRGRVLVAAFQDGVVRMHDMVTSQLQAELQAHSRLLSSMALHPTRDLFATVAEDATCNVWTLPTAEQPQVQNVLSVCWTHALLTGVAFTGVDDGLLAVAAYDAMELHVWKLD